MHWLLLLVVIGALYVIFARDTGATARLFGVATQSYSDVIGATNRLGNPA